MSFLSFIGFFFFQCNVILDFDIVGAGRGGNVGNDFSDSFLLLFISFFTVYLRGFYCCCRS